MYVSSIAAGCGLVVEAVAGFAVTIQGAAAAGAAGPAPSAVVFKFLQEMARVRLHDCPRR